MKKYFLATMILLFSIAEMHAQYCPLFGDCGEGSITTVKFNGVQNVTGCSSGYEDYTNTVTFQVQPAQVYNLFVDWDPFYDSHIYVWIDWDNSESWENETEYYSISTDNPPNSAGTLPILVPATAVIGDVVRMRVLHGSIDVVTDPCVGGSVFGHGEVEDYSVAITNTIIPPSEPQYCDGRGYSNPDPNKCRTDGDTPAAQANMWIGSFGIDNQFVNNSNTCGLDNGYSDYTNDYLPVVLPGETLSGTGQTDPVAGSLYHSLTIWVDWNQNGELDDPGEEFVANQDDGVNTYIFNLVAPPNALVGKTRMRVRAWDKLVIGYVPNPCGGVVRGEVEDYTIQVGDPVQCATHSTPADNQQNICTKGIKLTWSAPAAGPAANGYKVFLGTNMNANTIVNGQDVGLVTSYTHSLELPANTRYYWKIIAYNADGDAYGCAVDSFNTAMNIDPSIDQILLGGVDVDSTAVCADVDLAILATISGGTGTVDAAWTVSEVYLDNNPSNNPNFNTANNPSFTSADANKTYTLRLTATDDNFCSARESVKVYVKPAVEVGTLSANKAAVCANETVTLTLTGYNATITDWEKAEGVNPYASINHTQDVLATTINVDSQFKVLLTNGAGCEGESNQVTVTLKAAPAAPTISVSPANTACEGETIALTATPGTNIVWNDAGSSTTNLIEVSNNGTFNVTYTDPVTNCSATSSNEVITFNALPANPIISLAGVTCEGETVTLSTQYSTDLSWDLNGSGTVSTVTIDVTQDGTYTITYRDIATNCSNSSDEQITFTAKPTAPVIEQLGRELVTNPLQIVDWLDSDGNVVFTGDKFTPPNTSGQTFTALVIDGNSCESDESNEVAYDHTVSIARYNQIDFAVFPNPATSELNVQVHSSNAAGMYQIKDMAGRTVIAVELVSGINTISLSEIQSGIYMLQNSVGNTIRIVKQ
jgi:hypothetical protein